jgi:hypothetical protein
MIDSPANDHIKPPADVGGKAVAEVPNLPGQTPGRINTGSRYDELGSPHPCKVDGPAEVYTQPVNIRPPVKGPGHSPWDTPAGSTTEKK